MSNVDHIFPKKNYWNESEMFIIHTSLAKKILHSYIYHPLTLNVYH